MNPYSNAIGVLFFLALPGPAAAVINVIATQRDVSVSTTFTSENQSSEAAGDFDLTLPTSPGGPTGQNYELNASGAQTTTLTVTPNALSLLGQASIGSGATVTFPEGSLFAEASVQANAAFTLSGTAEFSLYGLFAGTGAAPDYHLSAIFFKAGEATPRAAIGYFQDGSSSLPGSPVTGVLEPGEYFMSLSLRSNSTASPTEDNQTVSRVYSGSVSNFAFTVQEIPEPSASLVAAGAFAVIAAARRRGATVRS